MILQTQDWVLGAERHILSKRRWGQAEERERERQKRVMLPVHKCVCLSVDVQRRIIYTVVSKTILNVSEWQYIR